jgi:hypothetical protein
MRSRVGHSASTTGCAKAASPANEGDHEVFPAIITMDAYESMGQYAAFQKRSQFSFDKPRNHSVALLLSCQKCFQIGSNHFVKNALFRLARNIDTAGFPDSRILIISCFLTIGREQTANHRSLQIVRG